MACRAWAVAPICLPTGMLGPDSAIKDTRVQFGRRLVASVLAGLLLALTALYVFDQLQHLTGEVPGSSECPICAWAQGVIAGAKVSIALQWILLALGMAAFKSMAAPAPLSASTAISRAPPDGAPL